jgi:hypothetical protein
MKKWLIFVSLIASILLGLIVYINITKVSLSPIVETEISKKIIKHSKEVIKNTERNQSIQNYSSANIKEEKLVKKENNSIGKTLEIYEVISMLEASMGYKPRPFIKPTTAIRMNRDNLEVGDTLILPDLEGTDYTVIISAISTNNDGSKSITGSYSDEGISYTTTMTQSSTVSFVTLATAQGSYEIATYNGIGYVYRTQDIRKHLQPSPKNDGIILDLPLTLDTIK